MYYETARFPFTTTLEQSWRVIRTELDALDRHEFIDWPEHSLYGDRGWETFGLYAFGQRQPEGCARCPQTEKLVRQIPGHHQAGNLPHQLFSLRTTGASLGLPLAERVEAEGFPSAIAVQRMLRPVDELVAIERIELRTDDAPALLQCGGEREARGLVVHRRHLD